MSIDIGKFLKTPEYDISITTYRDIFQVEAAEHDRFGEEYKKLSAVIFLGKHDFQKIGLKPGDRLKVSNRQGTIIVEARESTKEDVEGLAYMVNSPWSNALVSGDTGGKGIPDFKVITAKLSVTKEEITSIDFFRIK